MTRAATSHWRRTTLGEAFAWKSGGTPRSTVTEYYGGSIPWAVIGDLKDGEVFATENTLTEKGLAESSAKMIPPGAVLVGLYGSIGKAGIASIPMACNQAIAFAHPGESDAKWLLYYIIHARPALIGLGKGGTQSNINLGVLKAFPIALPDSAEQRRIVAEIERQFTRLDAGVAGLDRVRANLKRYRAAVLKAACEGTLVPTEAALARAEGRDYENGDQFLERILTARRENWTGKGKYKAPASPDTTRLSTIPEGWTWATAEQLTSADRTITYGVIKLGPHIDDGIPVLRSSDVRPLRLDLEGVKRISPAIASNYARTFLRGGEVVITVRGTLGGVTVVPRECSGFNISREVAMLAPVHDDFIAAKAISIFIGSHTIQQWLMRRAKGIAYTGINIETLKELPIPVPPLAEQRRIISEVERRLSIIDELQTLIETNLARAGRLRQSILAKAFSGELVPTA
jgi:type I restriction enzyme S subunit